MARLPSIQSINQVVARLLTNNFLIRLVAADDRQFSYYFILTLLFMFFNSFRLCGIGGLMDTHQ
jgi:hypothetical protein